KSTEPTGGVQSPMQRLRIMMIPKCTGSMPISVTMGRKIGVKISTAGVISIKVPTKRSIRFISNNITMGLLLTPKMEVLMVCGMFSNDITHDMAMEVPISNKTIADVLTAFKNREGSSGKDKFL